MDLSNIAVSFIDFDDSAVIHLDHTKWSDWFGKVLQGSPEAYLSEGRTSKLPGMQALVSRLREVGAKIFCLTWADFSIVVKSKGRVLDHYYGVGSFDDIIACGARENKVKFIERYCKENQLETCRVLVVDDHPDTVADCLSLGCVVMTPQEVVCRYGLAV